MSDPTPQAPQVVVGLGNEFRSDDGCGPATARQVAELCGKAIDVIQPLADGTGLIMAWSPYRTVFLIDSVKSGAPAGTIFRFEPLKEHLPEEVFHPTSSHRLTLSQIIRLAETLQKLPGRLILFGIEGINFDYGTAMTPEVAAAVNEVANRIAEEVKQLTDVPGHE
jgi:hydrogenase maturation protease